MSWENVDHSKLDCGIECPFCRCPILNRSVVNADGVGISAGTSEISVVIDPVHPDGEDDHITMSCTPLTTAQSIIDHVDPLIKREFPKIPFPKQHLKLLVQVWQGKKCISGGKFIRGHTLASIGFRDSYTLRLVRTRIKAPHRLLCARLQRFSFKPPVGKFTVTIHSRWSGIPSVSMNVTKKTTLSNIRKRLKRVLEASHDKNLKKMIKRAKRCIISGSDHGEWDHSTVTLEDLRINRERSNTLSYNFLRS